MYVRISKNGPICSQHSPWPPLAFLSLTVSCCISESYEMQFRKKGIICCGLLSETGMENKQNPLRGVISHYFKLRNSYRDGIVCKLGYFSLSHTHSLSSSLPITCPMQTVGLLSCRPLFDLQSLTPWLELPIFLGQLSLGAQCGHLSFSPRHAVGTRWTEVNFH